MASNQSVITQREINSLEKKAKQGWKLYFITRDYVTNISTWRNNQKEMINNIRSGGDVDIKHLTKMFLELYDKVGEMCDCPICMTSLVKENSHLPFCGHLVCKSCKEDPRLINCPICRRKY